MTQEQKRLKAEVADIWQRFADEMRKRSGVPLEVASKDFRKAGRGKKEKDA